MGYRWVIALIDMSYPPFSIVQKGAHTGCPDIERNERSCPFTGFLRVRYGGGDDRFYAFACPRELIAVRAKCVCVHRPRARVDIAAVDFLYHIRMGKAQKLRRLSCVKPSCLEHGAHSAVKQNEAVLFQ